ncbi:MAG: LUD domain-containing protein, partial [Flavobacteriaceae bacterium]
KAYKAALIDCEYLISNTGKILLSENQIRHFKLSDLPETIVVIASMDQLVRDVSQGMTFLKNKYPKTIPTNITTLKIKSDPEEVAASSTTSKSIYLLLEDK